MIVILEDNEDRQVLMRECLQSGQSPFSVHFFKTATEAIAWLRSHLRETVFIALDHDLELVEGTDQQFLDSGTGRDVADYLATLTPVCPILIHTTNVFAGIGMETVLKEAGWRTKRIVPYGDMDWVRESWFPLASKLL